MFKFLFRRSGEPQVVETQRQVFERALDELNGVIAQLEIKPAVTLDPTTGAISFAAPERFADEILALPAPDAQDESAEDDAEEDKSSDADAQESADKA